MDYGYHAWMLVAASLVLMMTTPALALFYGGMSRSKSVLNMMMMSFTAAGIVGIVYVLWGWSMSFGSQDIGMIINNPFETFGLSGIAGQDYIFVGFQMTFAIITAALISGAVADRLKFSAWVMFVPLWLTLSYFPIAHMVWGGGFLGDAANGVSGLLFDGDPLPIDYAGGTVVHVNAGVAALVLVLLLGKRLGFGSEPMKPHNLTLTMVGAGLLWFGWYGFNVGSIVFGGESPEADATQFISETSLVWLNTTVAAAAGIIGWLIVEKIRDRKATSLGAASGVVAGLVAITPACQALSPVGAILLGLVAGGLCAIAVGWKHTLGYDDSLDVVGVHLVGGLVGTVGAGFLSTSSGLLYGHGFQQLVVQVLVVLVAIVWSGVATLLVGLLVKYTIGLRIAEEDEVEGIDFVEHGESAYDLSPGGGGRRTASSVLARKTVSEGAHA
ncbi:ammonium transporter [Nocardioides sp.]|uniref:ammonium transporter n=1 Tax=Nocardioides sp. TaxID=35761 RepID=UPI0035698682